MFSDPLERNNRRELVLYAHRLKKVVKQTSSDMSVQDNSNVNSVY